MSIPKRSPTPPPVYRPNAKVVPIQAKPANLAIRAPAIGSPPVYRTNAHVTALQAKPSGLSQKARPVPPPVFRAGAVTRPMQAKPAGPPLFCKVTVPPVFRAELNNARPQQGQTIQRVSGWSIGGPRRSPRNHTGSGSLAISVPIAATPPFALASTTAPPPTGVQIAAVPPHAVTSSTLSVSPIVNMPTATGTPYAMEDDSTLTTSQANNGRFGTPADFRSRSNETLSGHSSGYHEAFVPTDYYKALAAAKANKNGTFTYVALGQTIDISAERRSVLMSVADTFRTDTARTVLSAPNGAVAGHSGSGVRQTNQAAAHDILREMINDLAIMSHPGITPESLAVAGGIVMCYSIAPAVLAATAENIDQMKDQAFLASYETARDQMKVRVTVANQLLTPAERAFTAYVTQSMCMKVGGGRLADGCVSPRRFTSSSSSSSSSSTMPQGGGYIAQSGTFANSSPSMLPPAETNQLGAYASEWHRNFRR